MANRDADPIEASDFMRRVLRCIAILCLADGLLGIGQFAVLYMAYPFLLQSMRYGQTASVRVEEFLRLSSVGMALFLVAGAVALLRWRSWSRAALIVWSVLSMSLGIVSFVARYIPVIEYARKFPASTQPHLPPMPYLISSGIFNVLSNWPFPLLVLFILAQHQVKEYWAKRSGGFEVIPFASAASRQDAI